jgi:hypothetical protein
MEGLRRRGRGCLMRWLAQAGSRGTADGSGSQGHRRLTQPLQRYGGPFTGRVQISFYAKASHMLAGTLAPHEPPP